MRGVVASFGSATLDATEGRHRKARELCDKKHGIVPHSHSQPININSIAEEQVKEYKVGRKIPPGNRLCIQIQAPGVSDACFLQGEPGSLMFWQTFSTAAYFVKR